MNTTFLEVCEGSTFAGKRLAICANAWPGANLAAAAVVRAADAPERRRPQIDSGKGD